MIRTGQCYFRLYALCLFAVGSCHSSWAQNPGGANALPAATAAAVKGALELPPQTDVVSAPEPVKGFNFTYTSLTAHSSLTGWSEVWTPDLSFRFGKHYAFEVNVPWYLSIKNFVAVTTKGATTYPIRQTSNVMGDTTIAAHLDFPRGKFAENFVASGSFPTGNVQFGLSSRTETYNLTNHMEYAIGRFTPDIEIGEGDASSLAQRDVKTSFITVGPLMNFQAGSYIDLWRGAGFDLEAYENLPMGNQKVYGTVIVTGKNGKKTTKQVLEGTGVAEDNGFNSALYLPCGPHFTLVGNYDRSLIQHIDTASMGFVWTLRVPKRTVSVP